MAWTYCSDAVGIFLKLPFSMGIPLPTACVSALPETASLIFSEEHQ